MSKQKRIMERARTGKPIRQVAAVPVRIGEAGAVEILLITSNQTGRFIVPKGWPMKGKSGRKAAQIEAMQEAGVAGKALAEPLGAYRYWKRLADSFVPVEVTVYLLPVAGFLPKWRESSRRQRAWLGRDDAATLIDEPDLAALVRSMDVEALRGRLVAALAEATARKPAQ